MLQFQLTADDYVAGNFLHSRWTLARWSRVGAMVAAFGAFVVWQMPHHPERALTMVAAYAATITVLLLGVRYVYLPWRSWRVFAQSKSLQRPISWSWDERQLSYKTDTAAGVVPWTDLTSWRESDALFALYGSPVAFAILPKRAFSNPEAITAFRELLQAKIAPKT